MIPSEVLPKNYWNWLQHSTTAYRLQKECQHKFSDNFEKKMPPLINGIGTACYTAAIQDSIMYK